MARSIEIIAFFVLGGLFLVRDGIRRLRRSRKIQDTARSKIISAPQGLVEVAGHIWPAGETIQTMIGKNAVYYDYKVESAEGTDWKTEFRFSHVVPFYIVDTTGVCLVHPHKHAMVISKSITSLHTYAESIEDLKKVCSTKPKLWKRFVPTMYRLVERHILIGEPIYVCGAMTPISANQMEIRGDYKKILSGEASKMSLDNTVSNIKVVGEIAGSEVHPLIIGVGNEKQVIDRIRSFIYLKITFGCLMLAVGIWYAYIKLTGN